MHKERTMGVLSDQFINITFQDAEFYQTANHDAHHFTSDFLNGSSRTIQAQAGFKRLQHNVIDFTLSLSEFAVDREGAGNIASVTFVFATSINQHQVTVTQFTLVFGVVQNAAVFTAADNGVIGRIARTVAVKFVVNFAFQMVLEHSRTAFFHRPCMCQGGDFSRAAEYGNLFWRFEQAHFMDHGTPVDHRCWRGEILSRTFTQFFQCTVHDFISICIFALSMVNHIQAVK